MSFPSSKANQKLCQGLLGPDRRVSSLAQCACTAITPSVALVTGGDVSTTLNTKKKIRADNLHSLLEWQV